MNWDIQFLELFRRCLKNYQDGNENYETYYSEQDLTFLSSIGYKPRELFDFIEDLGDGGDPAESTALLVAAVRRDYLLVIQNGQLSPKEISQKDIPSREDSILEMPYLPRLIAKAEAKLRGELHPDLMYCCGGDRRFLRDHGNIHPADFLRQIWSADGDHQKVALYVKESTAS